MPDISIIMPVYETEKYAEKAIQSLVDQTYKNIEIILIYDGKTDSINGKIIDDFVKKDNRIRVFVEPNTGAGPAAARNIGLRNATGRYIMFCDSDDWFEPEMCEKMFNKISNSNVDMVQCCTKILLEGKKHPPARLENIKHFTPHAFGIFYLGNERLLAPHEFVLWNKIFKKSLIDKFDIKFPSGHEHDDDVFMYQYRVVMKLVEYIPDVLHNYLVRPWSIMDRYFSGKPTNKRDRIEGCRFFYNWLEKNGFLPEKAELVSGMVLTQVWAHQATFPDDDVRPLIEEFNNLFFSRLGRKIKGFINGLVSIIIPNYNCAGYIGDCISSCLAQTYKKIEVVVVDDCSTDMGANIIKEYAEKDDRIIPIFHKTNAGVGAARNSALEAAHGEFIVFLDADDLLIPNAIEQMMLTQNITGAGIIAGRAKKVSDAFAIQAKILFPELTYDFNYSNNIDEFHPMLDDMERVVVWGKMFRHDIIGASHFVTDISVHEDVEFMLRMWTYTDDFATTPNDVYLYRQSNISVLKNKMLIDRIPDVIGMYNSLATFIKDDCRNIYKAKWLQKYLWGFLIDYHFRWVSNEYYDGKISFSQKLKYKRDVAKAIIKTKLFRGLKAPAIKKLSLRMLAFSKLTALLAHGLGESKWDSFNKFLFVRRGI